eukprot:9717196-Heterocapsa_arctica.AAC.1
MLDLAQEDVQKHIRKQGDRGGLDEKNRIQARKMLASLRNPSGPSDSGAAAAGREELRAKRAQEIEKLAESTRALKQAKDSREEAEREATAQEPTESTAPNSDPGAGP